MKLTTKNFRPDQILGEGGFGIVYKGVIDENVRPGYKSTAVAVKQLDPEGIQGDREWLVMIFSNDFFSCSTLSKFIDSHHINCHKGKYLLFFWTVPEILIGDYYIHQTSKHICIFCKYC